MGSFNLGCRGGNRLYPDAGREEETFAFSERMYRAADPKKTRLKFGIVEESLSGAREFTEVHEDEINSHLAQIHPSDLSTYRFGPYLHAWVVKRKK